MNRWGRSITGWIVAALMGGGGVWLAMHDRAIVTDATQQDKINELMAAKERNDRHVEEWRADQSRYETDLAYLKKQVEQSARERRAIYSWMERVSVRLGVAPPMLPDQGGGVGGAGGHGQR